MLPIITDVNVLHQKSVVITDKERICKELLESMPEHALGLAAPQIGIFETAFIANLSMGRLIFLNPEITWSSPDVAPSTESCLSLPGITKTVARYCQVIVKAEKIIGLENNEIRLRGLDAQIAQHEIDHLYGCLIVDLEEVKSRQEKLSEKYTKKMTKLYEQRHNNEPKKIIPAKLAKNISKKSKAYHKKVLKRLADKEAFLIEQKNLFDK